MKSLIAFMLVLVLVLVFVLAIGDSAFAQVGEQGAESRYSVVLVVTSADGSKYAGGGLLVRLNGECKVLTNLHNAFPDPKGKRYGERPAAEIQVRGRLPGWTVASIEYPNKAEESDPDLAILVLASSNHFGDCLPLSLLLPEEKRQLPSSKRGNGGKPEWNALGYGYPKGDLGRIEPEAFSRKFTGYRIRVDDVLYWRLDGKFSKGMSGSALFVGDLPVGMITKNVVTTEDREYGAVITNTSILQWLERRRLTEVGAR